MGNDVEHVICAVELGCRQDMPSSSPIFKPSTSRRPKSKATFKMMTMPTTKSNLPVKQHGWSSDFCAPVIWLEIEQLRCMGLLESLAKDGHAESRGRMLPSEAIRRCLMLGECCAAPPAANVRETRAAKSESNGDARKPGHPPGAPRSENCDGPLSQENTNDCMGAGCICGC